MMMKATRTTAIALALALSGCSAERDPEPTANAAASEAPAPAAPAAAPAPEKKDSPALAVEAEGLRLFDPESGAATAIAFGIAEAQLIEMMERLRGPAASRGTNGECGAGPMEIATWKDGLSLLFQEGRFVGWSLDERVAGTITTAAGIGPGSTRAELDTAYDATVEQTSLGTEFAAGDLIGTLDGTGANSRITDMWAGISCVFR